MRIIRVPRTPAAAFKRNRPISDLIRSQLFHVRDAEATLPPDRQSRIPFDSIATERQAAEYIRIVTDALHPDGARWRLPRGQRGPKSGVWLGPAKIAGRVGRRPTRRVRSKNKTKRAATSAGTNRRAASPARARRRAKTKRARPRRKS